VPAPQGNASVVLNQVNGIYNNATFDSQTRTCVCPGGMYLTQQTRVGAHSQLASPAFFSCVACPDNYETAADKRS
jgi:hypothetical protein